jgi:hypothetical protein
MGFWGDLWEGIKKPFVAVYDNVVKPVASTVSNVYDKVKRFIPAPLRAPLDTIQSSGRQIGDAIQTARDVGSAIGLKDGGMVLKEKMERSEPTPKKYYQA